MRPVVRAAITASAIGAGALLLLGYRVLDSHGMLQGVRARDAADCRAITAPGQVMDIATDSRSGIGFVATRGGVFSFLPGDRVVQLRRAEGAPDDVQPVALALAQGPSLLLAGRRAQGGYAVDVLSVKILNGSATLAEISSIESKDLVQPSAIAAVDSDHFYVANAEVSRSGLVQGLSRLLALPRGNILYFDGTTLRPVAGQLVHPSGLAISADGRTLYAAEGLGGDVVRFSRNVFSGALASPSPVLVPGILGKAHIDEAGTVWVARYPATLGLTRYDANAPRPSEVFSMSQEADASAVSRFADSGVHISRASIAAAYGRHLLIGSAAGNLLLDCDIR